MILPTELKKLLKLKDITNITLSMSKYVLDSQIQGLVNIIKSDSNLMMYVPDYNFEKSRTNKLDKYHVGRDY